MVAPALHKKCHSERSEESVTLIFCMVPRYGPFASLRVTEMPQALEGFSVQGPRTR